MLTSWFVLTIMYRKPLLFAFVGGISAILGAALLSMFVEVLKLNKDLAYFTQYALVLQFNFNINNFLTWKGPKATSYLKRWGLYMISRALTWAGGQIFFSVGMLIFDIGYMYIYIIDSLFWMWVNYRAGKSIFKAKETAQVKSAYN